MIFSHGEMAGWISKNFECAWESVRPVPTIEIDFHNGKKLKRTLNGNIATYFCTTDGKVFDILPGLVSREEFRTRAGLALKLHGEMAGVMNKRGVVSEYHSAMQILELADAKKIREVKKRRLLLFDIGKAAVEEGLKMALRNMLEEHAKSREVVDKKKRKVEQPIKDLMKDTAYNRKYRYPKVHAILALQPLVDPSTITKKIYKDVLNVDLDDPYLGLAPYVLGGEGGRLEGK